MPKLYPAQPFKPMTQVPTPQLSNPLLGRPVMQNMGNEPHQGFLGNPQQKPMAPKQQLPMQLAQPRSVTAPPSIGKKAADISALKQILISLAITPPPSILKALGI